MVVAALGGSPGTPEGGIEAQVIRFANLAELEAATAAQVRGRIVFIDEPMQRMQDGSGYGAAVAKRSRCAPLAQERGAVACLIRSVGTDPHRFAHQGGASRQAAGTTKAFFTFFMAAGVLFLCMSLVSNQLFARIEKWANKGTRRGEG